MLKIGFVGWRGMVGSVLMERINQENDLQNVEPFYFSTSQVGEPGPNGANLLDGTDVSALKNMDIVVTCQGSGYTKQVLPQLKQTQWSGYWIDAASALRMASHRLVHFG